MSEYYFLGIFIGSFKFLLLLIKSCLFHGLRHYAINHLRLTGDEHFVIKQASRHKTDSAFQRYNLVTGEEMKGMQWLDQQEGKTGMMDNKKN